MANEQLLQLLRSLHAELGRAETLDDESRALLKGLARDVERLTDAGEGSEDDHTPVLAEMAVSFESEHPALAGVLRRLVDALGKAGI